jgi:hypothetical protein
MMAIIFVLGVIGLTDAGLAWEEFEDVLDDDDAGFLLAVPIFADLALAGLLGAQVARFVPPVAGKTVAFAVGVVGLILAGGATVLAFDGMSVLVTAADPADRSDAWLLSLIVITVVMLITGGWAWESRKFRRSGDV